MADDVILQYKQILIKKGEEERLKKENSEFKYWMDEVIASDRALPIQAIYYWVEFKGDYVFNFPKGAEEWRKKHSLVYMVRACDVALGLELPVSSPDREVALEYQRKIQQTRESLIKLAANEIDQLSKPAKKWWQFWK